MKMCGMGTPHGEHVWADEDENKIRCPGRDTGDTTGLNAKPCGKTVPHSSHLWNPSARPWEVFRCFGALGPPQVKFYASPEATEPLALEQRPDGSWVGPEGSKTMWTEIGKTAEGDTVYAGPPIPLYMSMNMKEFTLSEFDGGNGAHVGSPDADPYRPHRNCDETIVSGQPHKPHNWTHFAEGQPHDVFCPGWNPGWVSPPKNKGDLSKYSKGEFLELMGSRFARCFETAEHGEHAWFNDRTDQPGGGKFQWWWCGGEPLRRQRDVQEDAQGWDPSQGDGTPEGTPEKRSLPVRWADRAMFEAEPIEAEKGPQVYLLWMTPDPLGAIAAACKMYKGEVVRSLQNISQEERLEYLAQVSKTKLKAPFEFVQFHFMLEGVSRSFTHQLVRQRTAAYAQESLRFAVKSDMPQYLPPSIAENANAREIWEEHNAQTADAYQALIDLGIPAEDARGRLPHDTLTRVNYTTNLRALLDHAGNRLCTQAQFEWRLVFTKIVEVIRARNINDPMMADGNNYVFMSGALTDLFRPVCYQTGKCEFKANFDRACSIRDRVDANAAIGRPSSEWHEDYDLNGYDPDSHIGAIKPGEWLLDHKAARRQ